MTTRRIPAQRDIQDQGRCGHGYRPSDGNHCGQPSEPGAIFGDCPEHARQVLEMAREGLRADRGYQSAERIERGDRVLDAERWENLGGRRPEHVEHLVRKDAIRKRGTAAEREQRPAPRSRTRGSR